MSVRLLFFAFVLSLLLTSGREGKAGMPVPETHAVSFDIKVSGGASAEMLEIETKLSQFAKDKAKRAQCLVIDAVGDEGVTGASVDKDKIVRYRILIALHDPFAAVVVQVTSNGDFGVRSPRLGVAYDDGKVSFAALACILGQVFSMYRCRRD